jgi:arabinofuranosyltransferase
MTTPNSPDTAHQLRGIAYLAILFTLFYLIVSKAWVTEDAYITFRVLDNFVNGFGLRWNVTERVQAFTNPLWLFVHLPVYYLTGEAYFTTLGISLLCSLAAVVVAIRAMEMSPGYAFPFLLVPLASSKAFIEYSTSGLENPLTFLLLALFFLVLHKRGSMPTGRWLLQLSLIAALSALNRLDTLLLYFPLFAYFTYRYFSLRNLGLMALGFAPLFAWLLFSLFYFGFLFPNTAYAKLSTGIPIDQYWVQGVSYALDLMQRDPASAIFLGFASAFILLQLYHFVRQRGLNTSSHQLLLLLMGLGGMLYCLYIIRIGGDFMSGRFWSSPLFLLVLVSAGLLKPLDGKLGVAGVFVGFALLLLQASFLPQPDEREAVSPAGIADERQWYLKYAALINYSRGNQLADHHHAKEGSELRRLASRASAPLVREAGSIGLRGYFSGDRVIWVDRFALTDPLLARLPITPHSLVFSTDGWRVGHYKRALPDGYLHAVESGDLSQMDPVLAQYYQRLALVVAGPLFDLERLKTILLLNLGSYDHYLENYILRHGLGASPQR